MDGVPVVAWSILGDPWLVTAPGVLVAFGAVGGPPAVRLARRGA